MSKFQRLLWSLPALAQLMLSPAPAPAEEPTAAAASAEAEVRQAIRDYDEALRRVVDLLWHFDAVSGRGSPLHSLRGGRRGDLPAPGAHR